MSNKLTLMMLPLAMLLWSGCQQKASDSPRQDQAGGVIVGAPAYYTTDILPLLQTNCLSCHGPSGPNTPNLSNYQTAQIAGQQIKADVDSGHMPPTGKLPAAQVQLIDNWVNAGMPQTNTGAVITPGTTAIAYDNWVSSWLAGNCLSCHSGLNQPTLSSYAYAQANAQAILTAVSNGTMPQNGPRQGADVVQNLQAWVSAGAPQTSTGSVPTVTTGQISYSNWVSSWLAGNCLSCHAGQYQPNLASYANARAYAQTIVSDVQTGRMPQNGVRQSTDVVQKLQAWLQAGAPQDVATQTGSLPTTTTGAVTYSNGVSQVLASYCLSCHAGQYQPNLASYANARAYAQTIVSDVQTGRMPQTGQRLSAQYIQILQQWVAQGTLQ